MDHDHRLAEAVILLSRETRDLTHEFKNAMEKLGSLCQGASKLDLDRMEIRLMATQTEIAAQLRNAVNTINKIGSETDTLIQKVKDLQDAVNNQANASQELIDAAQAVADQLKVVDEKVPDAVETPTDTPATPPGV